MPLFGLVRMWVWGLVAVALLVGASLLVWQWSERLPAPPRPTPGPAPDATGPTDTSPPPTLAPPTFGERLSAWRPGWDWLTAMLAGAVALTALAVGGGRVLLWLFIPKTGPTPPGERRGQPRRVGRPDGSDLHVEVSGRADGPLVVLCHGWGATSTEWGQLCGHLEADYRVVNWDLRGLGRSSGPKDRNFSVDAMTEDLRAVLDAVGGGPAVLIGHSIGGMILLNLAKLHPHEFGTRVNGLVIVHSTPTNPAHTTKLGEMLAAVQKPLLEPLAWLMIGLSPLVWAMNALSYLNGSAHWSNYRNAFGSRGTWPQVEFASRYVLGVWPAAYARGSLGMFRYHAEDALGRVTVPTLVVVGDRDGMTVPAAGERIRAGVPAGELVTLAACGHMGPIQQADQLAAAVRAFLGRHHRGRTG